MVQLDRIRRQFGTLVLFEDLSWMIPPDARTGLVGPNGAGKTTLLRILAGEDRPDGGAVRKPEAVRIGYLPQEVESVGEGGVLATVLNGMGELKAMEHRLEDLERRMASIEPGDPALDRATTLYGELRHRFELQGGDRVEVRARAILTGLGVPESSFHRPISTLSGGWRMRVALARLLLGKPGLLLLDEPTNHLDLEALAWMEEFLEGYEGAFLVVAHDRYFLNRMVRTVAELDRGRLTLFPGNYDDYLEAKAARAALQAKTARHQARQIARVERFIERFRFKASKARQVQSRVRALGKTERIEAPARGSRRIRFGFPPAPRSGDWVTRADGVSKAFGDKVVYRELQLVLRRGDRLALVGPNGAGKSTLLKLLAGVLRPDAGSLELGHNVTVQYYAQHQLEALDARLTVLETLEKIAGASDRQRLRNLLGGFLFTGEEVERRVFVLSGGEKARLAIARMLLQPANLLLLDEPTNHLDLRSREVVEEALNEYEGTLVLVSHDRYFVNRVATAIAEVGDGRVDIYPGDYDTFLDRKRERESAGEEASRSGAPEKRRERLRRRDARRTEAEDRNRRYRERRAVEETLGPLEAEIATAERRIRDLTELQADPRVYRDPDRAAEVGREKADAERRLERLYSQWESLAARLH